MNDITETALRQWYYYALEFSRDLDTCESEEGQLYRRCKTKTAIVIKAVNSHEKLLKTLDRVMEWLEQEMFDDDDRHPENFSTQEERAENLSDIILQVISKCS